MGTNRGSIRLAMAALVAMTVSGWAEFTAYNDFKWETGDLSSNITTNGPANASNGSLINYASGASLGASMTMGGAASPFQFAVSVPMGSDAYNVFNGKVSLDNYTYWSAGSITLTLSGLDTNAAYSFVFFSSRGSGGETYSNRWTDVTISDVLVYTNNSSAGITKFTSSSANDSSRTIAANMNGLVARYDGIKPGSDGDVLFTFNAGGSGSSTNAYLNGFMLQEFGGTTNPAAEPGGTIRYHKGTSEASSPVATWRDRTYDATAWSTGATPFGYGDAVSYGTQLSDMQNAYSTLYVRYPFLVTNAGLVDTLTITTDFDDGYIAWVNGTQVAISSNAPGSPTYTSLTQAGVDHESYAAGGAAGPEIYNVANPGNLITGTNIMAVMGFNVQTGSSDFYLSAAIGVNYLAGPSAPTVANAAATVQSYSSATANGTLSSTGAAPTQVWLYWQSGSDAGTTKAAWGNVVALGYKAAGSLAQNLSSLVSNTTYYYRFYASNAAGSAWGSPAISFTTPGSIPVVTVSLSSSQGKRQWYTSTKRTGFIVSEIMYNPCPEMGEDAEFIEIYNTDSWTEEIGGWKIAGDVSFTFPTNATIPGRQYIVVAKNPTLIQSLYGLSASIVYGPYSNYLDNTGGNVTLKDDRGAVLFDANYEDSYPWPASADGPGHSLALMRPDYGEGDIRAWQASDTRIGNPANSNRNYSSGVTLKYVKINEILAHTDPPQEDFIELYNDYSSSVNVGGCYLSDDVDSLRKYQIPTNTMIASKGVLRFNQTTLGFALSMHGGGVYFMNAGGDVILDAIKYDAQANGTSYGRWPNGQAYWTVLNSVTENTSNNGTTPRIENIVINEIMFNPLSMNDDDEYIELFNRSGTNINVGYWRFTDGIDYMIPSGKVIAAGSYLVVAKNAAHLLATHTNLSASSVVGDYSGTLSDGGERIVLAKPDDITLPFQDFVVMDVVTYEDTWGEWVDGRGSSLELRDPDSDNSRGLNWTSSDESAKSDWTTLEATGNLDNEDLATSNGWSAGNPSHYLRQLTMFLNGAGECLIDDVICNKDGTSNDAYVQNSDLNTDSGNWVHGTAAGNHKTSVHMSSGGYGNSGCIKLIASGRGEERINGIGCYLDAGLNPNDSNVKIQLKARWLRGNPTLNLRLNGGGLWAVKSLHFPENVGTPGSQNSQYASNVGPAIDEMEQSPIYPAGAQAVTVTARLRDPDGVASADIKWRTDGGAHNTASMNDSGTGVDATAGDEIWSGQISGQNSGTVVGFYIQAADSNAAATAIYPVGAPTNYECYMIFGQSLAAGDYANMRVVLPPHKDADGAGNAYYNWDRMDGSDVPCTVIYNDSRPVHGGGFRLSGSIWSRPRIGTDYWGYTTPDFERMQHTFRVEAPRNDKICDATAFVLDALNYTSRGRQNTGPQDNTFIRERLQYWVLRKLGLPSAYHRYYHLFVNSTHHGIIHGDTMMPDEDSMATHVPDHPVGDLLEVKGWYETRKDSSSIDQGGGGPSQAHFIGPFYHDDGSGRPEMYRLLWDKKPKDWQDYDMEEMTALANALNISVDSSVSSQLAFFRATSRVLDPEQWARSLAFRGAHGDGDTWMNGGRNKFLYHPDGGKALLLDYDLDWGFGYEGGGLATTNWGLPIIERSGGSDVQMSNKFWKCNANLRAYYRGVKDVMELWSASSLNPIIDRMKGGHTTNNLAAWKYVNRDDAYDSLDDNVMASSEFDNLKTWAIQKTDHLNRNYMQPGNLTNTSFSASGPGSSAAKIVNITGNAPIQARWIKVNGITIQDVNIAWTTTLAYSFELAMTNTGNNNLAITAWDNKGNQVGSTQNIVVNYSGSLSAIAGNVVINEIQYDSALENGGFIELKNNSSEDFDLSGYRLNGVGFVFPRGSFIKGNNYAVVAKSEAILYGTYQTSGYKILGEYPGSLDNGGETISLEQPQVVGAVTNWLVVDQVKYDDDRPWPNEARHTGYSLQLIDSTKDNNRAANWSTQRKWTRVVLTGVAGVGSLYLSVDNAGEVLIDDLQFVQGSTPGVGANLLQDGDFEDGFPGAWSVGEAYRFSEVIDGAGHSGTHCLRMKSAVGGQGGAFGIVQSGIPLTGGQTYTLSFWYLPATTGSAFQVRTSGSWLNTGVSNVSMSSAATPGSANSMAGTLNTIPDLWLNEVRPNASTPWIELFNASGSSINLDTGAYYLSDDYDSLTKWEWTSGETISANGRRVVQANGTGGTNTSFTLSPSTGYVALVQLNNSRTTVLDYLDYALVAAGKSYGSYPEGDATRRQVFDTPTPGTANNGAVVADTILINEWMAEQDALNGVNADPADGDFDDWVELYNPGGSSVDVTGWRISDSLINTNGYAIPAGAIVPSMGHLLIWLDGETGQNTPGVVHADFSLDNMGEAVVLRSPAGTLIDSVSFGAQVDSISEGLYPDGSSAIFTMAVPTPGATNKLFGATTVSSSGGNLQMTWNTRPGQSYRLMSRDSLTSGAWSQQMVDTNAQTGTLTISIPVSGSRRLYQLIQNP